MAKEKIEELWKVYRKSMIPKKLSPKLVKELKQAFFAGAAAMYSLMIDIGDMDEAEQLSEIDRLHAEISDFWGMIDVRYLGHRQQGDVH